MITKGSLIELVKPMGLFTNVGEVCEVVNVTEDGVITFKFGCRGHHLGCMSYDEFQKYFKQYEEPVKKREWTEWTSCREKFRHIDDSVHYRYVSYRSNGRYVEVRCGSIKASASCHKDDKFDIKTGYSLALNRLKIKILSDQVNRMAAQM